MSDKSLPQLSTVETLNDTDLLYLVRGGNSDQTIEALDLKADILTYVQDNGGAGEPGVDGIGYGGTATAQSLSVGAEEITLTLDGDAIPYAYLAGQRARVVHTSDSDVWMEGPIVSFVPNSIVINVDLFSGEGEFVGWSVGLAGEKGMDGVGFTFRGEFLADNAYAINDVTTYNGAAWVCISPDDGGPSHYPGESEGWETFWELFVSNGTNAPLLIATVAGNSTFPEEGQLGFSLDAPAAGYSYGFSVGMRVRAFTTSSPENFVEGSITSYSSTFEGTSMVVTYDVSGGELNNVGWTIVIVGAKGVDGADGKGYFSTSSTDRNFASSGDTSFVLDNQNVAFSVGQFVHILSRVDQNYMLAVVRSLGYEGEDLILGVTILSQSGGDSDSRSDWDINLAGLTGAAGQGYRETGAWDSGLTTYSPYDIVTYNGSSYVAYGETAGSTGAVPDAEGSTSWLLFASKGSSGRNSGPSWTVATSGPTDGQLTLGTHNISLALIDINGTNQDAYLTGVYNGGRVTVTSGTKTAVFEFSDGSHEPYAQINGSWITGSESDFAEGDIVSVTVTPILPSILTTTVASLPTASENTNKVYLVTDNSAAAKFWDIATAPEEEGSKSAFVISDGTNWRVMTAGPQMDGVFATPSSVGNSATTLTDYAAADLSGSDSINAEAVGVLSLQVAALTSFVQAMFASLSAGKFPTLV